MTVLQSRALLSQSRISDIASYLVAMSDSLSDAHSDLKSAIGGITVTLGASDISDIASAVLAGLTGLTASDISDIASAVWANTIGARVDSRLKLTQSQVSDVASYLVVMSGVQSDIYSAVLLTQSAASDAASAATQANSRVLLLGSAVSDVQSYLVAMSGVQSDIYSLLSDVQSDFQSRVPKRVATDSQLSDLHSDLRSYLVAMSALDSDVQSAVAVVNSRVLLNQSRISDIASYLVVMSGVQSDIYSLLSDVGSDLTVMSGVQSDIYSLLSDFASDFGSRIPATFTELASVPGATPSLRQAVMLPFMFLRNDTEGTPTKRKIKTAAGTTITSATVGWNATTSVFDQGTLG
jgi:hypothetical protein